MTKERELIRAIRRRLSYANVTATIALFVALSAGAYAAFHLPRNSVRSNNIKNGQVKARDIGNNQVRSSDIKDSQIKSSDIKDGNVTGADIGAGQVGAAQLAQPEAFHLVGTAGQPAFGTGGQNDCIWHNFQSLVGEPRPYNPTGFYEDPYGVVHLTGGVQSVNGGPGNGDGQCGGAGQDGIDDATAFVLPAADRPPHELLFTVAGGSGTTTLAVTGTQDVDAGNGIHQAGAVIVGGNTSGTHANLDGVDFRAAGPGTGIAAPRH